jgi:hypothetical protein
MTIELTDYETALASDSVTSLAASLEALLGADDTYDIGLGLVQGYARAADMDRLPAAQRTRVGLFRRAASILDGDTLVGGVTYGTLRANSTIAGRRLTDHVSDAEARELIASVINGEPALGWLVADRYEQKIRSREAGYRGGPDLEEHIQIIQDTLDSDPEGRLAVSLDNLVGSNTGRRLGINVVEDFVRGADPEAFTGALRADLTRLKRAYGILRNEIALGGLTYVNVEANVYGMMGKLGNFATSTEARDIIHRIIAGVPVLAVLAAAAAADWEQEVAL